jgi:DNA-binding MarR family transcriptional regulator
MDEKEFYKRLGYVKISKYRTKTLKSLGDDVKMPSEIARENDVKTSQISAALSDLKKEGLVICINDNVRKGRLYKATEDGLKLIRIL